MLDYTGTLNKKLEMKKVKTVKIPEIKRVKKKEVKKKKNIKEKNLESKKMKKSFKPVPIDVSLKLDVTEGIADFSLDFDMEQSVDFSDLVFEIDEVDQKPVAIVQISPIYPINAKVRGIEGIVNLLFVVDQNGNVTNVDVLSSENGEYFDKVAVKTMSKWKFKPAIKNGEKVSVKVTIPLNFSLRK